MTKRIKYAAAVLFMSALCMGLADSRTAPQPSAGTKCWQVDCNTCCRGVGGGVICTQRACV